jgi:acetyl-CoA acetyltransferase
MAQSPSSVVIVDAVRTPVGRRGGGLASMHPADLLGLVQKAIIDRTGIDPAVVEQVVGGCVSQVGEQSFNVTRTAWLNAVHRNKQQTLQHRWLLLVLLMLLSHVVLK